MMGSSGRSRRSHRKICRLSESPRGKSNRSRSGAAPDCTRSMASQPLLAVSRCQELDSPIDHRGRKKADSRLTTSRRVVSIAFSATGLVAPLDDKVNRVYVAERKTLQGFDVISFDANRQRPLNGIDGQDQGTVPVAGNQNTFHAVQGAASNAHALTNLEERMGGPGQLFFDEGPHSVDLLLRNRSALSPNPHKVQHAINLEHTQALFAGRRHAYKHIATEQWEFNRFLAIAPATYFRD